jgi:hypothetical protein
MLNPHLCTWSDIVEKLQINVDGISNDAKYHVAC